MKITIKETIMKWIENEDKTRYMSLVGICFLEVGLIFLAKLFTSDLYKCTNTDIFDIHKEKIIICLIVTLFGFVLVLFPLVFNRKSFRFSRQTMAQLLASVISSQTLNIIYLCLFVIHISCLGSATYSLLVDDNELLNGIITVIFILGCIVIIGTFPNPKRKGENNKKVFISGISWFSFNNPVIEKLQLYPIIREFFVITGKRKNVVLEEEDKMHIILSKDINFDFMEQRIIEAQKIKFEKSPKSANSQESVEWFNKEIIKIKSNKDFLKTITCFIKLLAKYAYYDDNELCKIIENLEINYTIPTNYNNFEDCFEKTKTILKEYEEEDYDVIINCSPGTATLTAALTILSMARNRRLLYFSQDETVEIKHKMIEIMANKINFKEFIENVSEELSYPVD